MRYKRKSQLGWLSMLMLGGCLCCCLPLAGCGYDEVGPHAYQLTISLDQALELKRTDQLQTAGKLLDEALAAGDITEREHDYLSAIVAQGLAGNWSEGRRECRKLLADQTAW